MTDTDVCINCGKLLFRLDKALHRKLISRGAEEFMCKHCLAEYFHTTEAHLDELAEYYRKEGCTLFD